MHQVRTVRQPAERFKERIVKHTLHHTVHTVNAAKNHDPYTEAVQILRQGKVRCHPDRWRGEVIHVEHVGRQHGERNDREGKIPHDAKYFTLGQIDRPFLQLVVDNARQHALDVVTEVDVSRDVCVQVEFVVPKDIALSSALWNELTYS